MQAISSGGGNTPVCLLINLDGAVKMMMMIWQTHGAKGAMLLFIWIYISTQHANAKLSCNTLR